MPVSWRAYVSYVKCMYTKVHVHIVDYSGLIGGIYTDIDVSYVDMN